MRNWKSIVGGIVALAAYLTIEVSKRFAANPLSNRSDRVVLAAATLLAVVVLHWLLWRFIIPSASVALLSVPAFFQSGRGFFRGTIAFGYALIALYCFELSLSEQQYFDGADIGSLGIGLFLIGLGTAARVRDAFSELSVSPDRRLPSP